MPKPTERVSFFKSVRTAFFAGVIALSPILVTVFVFNWLIVRIGGNYRDFFLFFLPTEILHPTGSPYARLLSFAWDLSATFVAFAQITLLGYLTRYVTARFFFLQTERLMRRVPLIGAIYNTVKQIVETFSSQQRAVFQKVVLIQFPRNGSYAIGFLTSRARGEAQARTTNELWNVFVPTTPNPTSGFLVMLARDQIVEMDMTVGDAMKLIISGGAVVPPWPVQREPGSDTDELPPPTATDEAPPTV